MGFYLLYLKLIGTVKLQGTGLPLCFAAINLGIEFTNRSASSLRCLSSPLTTNEFVIFLPYQLQIGQIFF